MEQPTGHLQRNIISKLDASLQFPHTGALTESRYCYKFCLAKNQASELAGQLYLYVQAGKRHQQLWLPHFIVLGLPNEPVIPVDDQITPQKTDQISDFLKYKYKINYLIPSFSCLTSGFLWISLHPHSSVVSFLLCQKVQSCQ